MIDPRTVPVRFSRLKNIGLSPAHYVASLTDDDDTLARRIGRGVHAVLFNQPFAVWDGGQRRGKKWDAWKKKHADVVQLNVKEHAHSKAVADAVLNNSIARDLLFGDDTVREETLEWRVNGRLCRGTPDCRNRRRVVDLKTHRRMPPARFVQAAQWMGYAAQLDWYREGGVCNGLVDEDAELFIVAVESVRPYAVTCYRLTDRAAEMGRKQWSGWMESLLVCEASGQFPAYAQSILPFDVAEDDELQWGDEGDDNPPDPEWIAADNNEAEAA